MVEGWSLKSSIYVLTQKPVNETLFGKSIFAHVMKLSIFEMRSCWIQVGPKSNDKCPYKRHTQERHRDKRESHVKTKAEFGVMQS